MIKNKCLYCYEKLEEGQYFHSKCAKKFFGSINPPELPYSSEDMTELASKVIQRSISLPGVQSKISMGILKNNKKKNNKLTIVGLWGEYILKPPVKQYPFMPELESLTMKLAEYFGITTVPNSLIRMKSQELAYITKRIDRFKNQKYQMEDMAQLTNKLTEQKYQGSLELIAKTIKKYSDNIGFDLLNFFEINLFSFITGNADMHLKNFSLIYQNGMYSLTPAYDLLPTRLLIPENEDSEEFALTMNGKKRNFNKNDFLKLSRSIGILEKVVQNSISNFLEKANSAKNLIGKSFLPKKLQKKYIDLIENRIARIK